LYKGFNRAFVRMPTAQNRDMGVPPVFQDVWLLGGV
jgi:hypothetical protein